MANVLLCCKCGQPIPNQRRPGVAEWVSGLRVNRDGGGPNQIRRTTSLGLWVCHLCVANGNPNTAPMF